MCTFPVLGTSRCCNAVARPPVLPGAVAARYSVIVVKEICGRCRWTLMNTAVCQLANLFTWLFALHSIAESTWGKGGDALKPMIWAFSLLTINAWVHQSRLFCIQWCVTLSCTGSSILSCEEHLEAQVVDSVDCNYLNGVGYAAAFSCPIRVGIYKKKLLITC